MCGRFSQSMTREDYLALLADEVEQDIPYDLNRSDVSTLRQAPKFCF